jgi:hypothetical protein
MLGTSAGLEFETDVGTVTQNERGAGLAGSPFVRKEVLRGLCAMPRSRDLAGKSLPTAARGRNLQKFLTRSKER